ncbi:hypothetical protein NX84_01630 [Corynebacterium minutissimum]|nr:hypothetical protein NX84_01630 [Corynebacterium minutissimum]
MEILALPHVLVELLDQAEAALVLRADLVVDAWHEPLPAGHSFKGSEVGVDRILLWHAERIDMLLGDVDFYLSDVSKGPAYTRRLNEGKLTCK